MRALAIMLLLAAAGCGGMSVKVPEKVYIESPVPCVKADKRPKQPDVLSEDDLMALPRYERTVRAFADLTKLRIHAAELGALVEGCSRIPARN